MRSLHIPAVGTKSSQLVGSVAHGQAAPMLRGVACAEHRGTTPLRAAHDVVYHELGA